MVRNKSLSASRVHNSMNPWMRRSRKYKNIYGLLILKKDSWIISFETLEKERRESRLSRENNRSQAEYKNWNNRRNFRTDKSSGIVSR